MNPTLDDTSMNQAEALDAIFANVALARVIASPLQRARQTAALIADLPDDPRAIHQRTGCWNQLVAHGDQWQAPVINARLDDGHRL